MADINSTLDVSILDDNTSEKVGVDVGRLKIVMVDSNGNEIDIGNNAISTINHQHLKIHKGKHFVISEKVTVNNGVEKYFLISVPTGTQPHLNIELASEGGTFSYHEAPSTSNNGTPVTPINSNRNSSNTSALSTYEDPTVTSDGTTLFTDYLLKETLQIQTSEIILKENTTYLFKFIPDYDGVMGIKFRWYE